MGYRPGNSTVVMASYATTSWAMIRFNTDGTFYCISVGGISGAALPFYFNGTIPV